MLQKLSIRNYALIDQLDIAFDNGLNIITGETGAGKSIILGALSLILGQRAEGKYFFNQENKCIIEGTFNIKDYHLKALFETLDIDYDVETILRREIAADGKSRAFINDTPVNLTVLKQLSEQLIDIHSQHAVLEINDANFQLLTIDSLAGHEAQLIDYQYLYKKYKKNLAKLSELETAQQHAANELDYNQFLFNELDSAGLKLEEQENLALELEQLNNAEHIKSNLLTALDAIEESEVAATTSIKDATNKLGAIERFNPEIEIQNKRLQSIAIELKDVAAELALLEQKTNFSPEKAATVSSRLDLIYSLQQKHRASNNAALLDIMEALSEKLFNYSSDKDAIEALQKLVVPEKEQLIKLSGKLSENRAKVFDKVEQEISNSLSRMGMPNAQLIIANDKLEPDAFTSSGIDRISFLFSANAGQAPALLSKIASGGELSRFMLAVKSLISANTALPTIIFDEIDTGISGDTAIKVGNVMAEMANKMQVITITHLPQIAAKGTAHYFVYKEEAAKKTTTGIRKLNQNERVEIIAEMLSGKIPGASALQNARELLG